MRHVAGVPPKGKKATQFPDDKSTALFTVSYSTPGLFRVLISGHKEQCIIVVLVNLVRFES